MANPVHISDATPHCFTATRWWRAFPAGMRRRWWLFRLFDLIVRHWPVAGPRRGVLVVRMDGIGDMILFRGSLDHYAEAFGVEPDAITILGCNSWAPVAEEVFAGFRVEAIDEHAFARNPFYRFRVGLRVRRLNAAVAVSDSYLRRALMADSLVWLSAAPRTVVSVPFISARTRAEYTYYLSQASQVIDSGDYPDHEIIRHHRFVSALLGRSVELEAPAISWHRPPPAVAAGGPYVVLNPGSNEPGRRWPAERYRDIAERIRGGGVRVVVVGADAGSGFGADAGGVFDGVDIEDLRGATDLPALFDVLKYAAAVVSNDSGPAHVAIALGTPTVVIVGGGHLGCFVPYPETVCPPHARFVNHPMACYHCFWRCDKRVSDADAFPCVGEVDGDRVWTALKGLLAEAG